MGYAMPPCWAGETAVSHELTFKNKGNPVAKLSLDGIKKRVAPQAVKVFEPHEKKIREYVGFPMSALLTAVYGDAWKRSEDILFTCLDGYQPTLPVKSFIDFAAHLVFERPDQAAFKLFNVGQNEEVELGPFYLVWDNLAAPGLKSGGAYGWPYQVTTIDLVRFHDRFPNMIVPEAPEPVKQGFVAFRRYCMNCHSINGDGGKKGIDLNFPQNVTERYTDDWLRKWIDNPRSLRPQTTMPALNPDAPEREQKIESILTYLKFMAGHKKKRP